MDSFATIEDLEARWKPITDARERYKADVTLCDATTMIKGFLGQRTADPEALVMVTCNVAKRALVAADTNLGVTQQSETAGPYSQSFTWANPGGDLYLTAREERLLGLKKQTATVAYPWGGSDD